MCSKNVLICFPFFVFALSMKKMKLWYIHFNVFGLLCLLVKDIGKMKYNKNTISEPTVKATRFSFFCVFLWLVLGDMTWISKVFSCLDSTVWRMLSKCVKHPTCSSLIGSFWYSAIFVHILSVAKVFVLFVFISEWLKAAHNNTDYRFIA